MSRYVPERIATSQCKVGESPVWDPQSNSVMWVDIPNQRFFRIAATGGAFESWVLPVTVSAFARRDSSGFIAATRHGFADLTMTEDGPELAPAKGPALPEGWRMNDAACDRQGRFWSGSLSPTPAADDAYGSLFSLGKHAEITPRGGQFRVQNGLAWSPDGRTMYVSDSHITNPHVRAYDFEPETGARSNGRLFADHAKLGGRPDGAAMDVDGCYWIAASDSGRVLRLTPAGEIDAEIVVGVTNPTNICFGGSDMKTAFITSLCPDGGMGGDLFAVSLPFQGMAEPLYRA